MELVCEECQRESDDGARGWQGYLIAPGNEEDVDDAERVAVFFCPRCAAREFGRSRTIGERRPGW